jgi:quinol monooxygenase YgiN
MQRRHGARYLAVWFDEKARKAFCLMEAPNAECAAAVHRETPGPRADRIFQVTAANDKGEAMTAPFVFIGTYRFNQGKLEAFKQYWQEFVKSIETEEPQLIAFNAYVNDEGTELSVVQVHPDADSMLFHMGVAGKHISAAYGEYFDNSYSSTQIFGTPTDTVLAMMSQLAGPGASVTVKPDHIGGFTRSAAENPATARSR